MGKSLKPGEKRETGGAGQVVRCLWGVWTEYMGGSSSSHTDQKGMAQGIPEGRLGTAVKGISLGDVFCIHVRSHGSIEPTVQTSPGHRLGT